MSFGVFNDQGQRAYFFVAIVLMPFAIAAVILRFLAVSRSAVKYQAEDWLALTSLVLYLTYDATTIADVVVGDGRDTFGLLHAPEDLVVVRKLTYSALWLYFWQQYFAKLSIMSLYYRLFHVDRKFLWCIYGLLFYHVAWIITVSFILGFHCRPLEKFWHPLIDGTCVAEGTFFAVSESINSFGDFLLVALAIDMVRTLQMSKGNRWRLRILFGSGAFAGIIGIIKIGMSFNDNAIYVFTMVAIWSNVQAAVAIVCCCAPVYKPILPEPGFWMRLTSKVSLESLRQRHQRSRGSDASPNHSTAKRSGSENPSQRQRQGWLDRDDGSSSGLVWSERQENPTKDSAYGGVGQAGTSYPLEAIAVREDIEVRR